MLRSKAIPQCFLLARGLSSRHTPGDLPVPSHPDAKKKTVDSILGVQDEKEKRFVEVRHESAAEAASISGVPMEHLAGRTVRIYRPARGTSQAAFGRSTDVWKIEFDSRERWENPLMGWASNGDPQSNTSMMLTFASREDAIHFAEKNNWQWEVEKEQLREIRPKSYSWNYAWNNRKRVSTK
ncbi:unnamed protein product, partial [Mesorhabditis spiculigera]